MSDVEFAFLIVAIAAGFLAFRGVVTAVARRGGRR